MRVRVHAVVRVCVMFACSCVCVCVCVCVFSNVSVCFHFRRRRENYISDYTSEIVVYLRRYIVFVCVNICPMYQCMCIVNNCKCIRSCGISHMSRS